jgi:Uncharacterized protein conserved in bacteria (DUF2334)
MRYVIIRDDDINALTPIGCLERLYRPFLDRGLPVNLAVIPDVATDTLTTEGLPEGYLFAKDRRTPRTLPIAENAPLVHYLLDNPGFRIVQHGCHHEYFEFDRNAPGEIRSRLDRGVRLLQDSGFPKPKTFVAPYDRISRGSLREIVKRFDVLSTGWFQLSRIPWAWWPNYALKKLARAPHWLVGRTLLLSHPGCILSCQRNYDSILENVVRIVQNQRLTVLVTHWWEYFRSNQPDNPFIEILHQTAGFLASSDEIRVVSFDDLIQSRIPLG